jgi:hypothetical protein
LRRNAIIALGNSGHREFVPLLNKLAANEDPVLSKSADWAKERLERKLREDSPLRPKAQCSDEQPAAPSLSRDSI